MTIYQFICETPSISRLDEITLMRMYKGVLKEKQEWIDELSVNFDFKFEVSTNKPIVNEKKKIKQK